MPDRINPKNPNNLENQTHNDDFYINLSNEELCVLVINQDTKARDFLIIKNLNFIQGVALDVNKLFQHKFSLDDMKQEGVLGLIEAIDKYREGYGTSFTTYAYYWIWSHIMRAIQQTGYTIYIPAHMLEKIKRIKEVLNDEQCPEQLNDRLAYIQNQTNYDIKTIETALYVSNSLMNTRSLEYTSGNDEIDIEDVYIDQSAQSTQAIVDEVLLKEAVFDMMQQLNPREQQVLIFRYGLLNNQEHTFKQISLILKLSEEGIRKIHSRSLKKLNTNTAKQILKDHLEYEVRKD